MSKILLALTLIVLTSCSVNNNWPQTRLEQLQYLHTVSLSHHVYITDMDQYGVEDKWVTSLIGDCEDYALYIQRVLGKGEKLVVKTIEGEAHMVLLVDGYVIDNTSKSVYLYQDMKHFFVMNLR